MCDCDGLGAFILQKGLSLMKQFKKRKKSHIKSILTDFSLSPLFFLHVIFKRAKIDQKYCIITVVSRDYETVIDTDQPYTNHSFSYNFRYTVIWL